MRKGTVGVALFLFLVSHTTGIGTNLPPEKITEAILFGETPGNHPEKTLSRKLPQVENAWDWLSGLWGSHYALEASVITPFLKVAFEAGKAHARGEKFTQRNVTKEMIEPKAQVIVFLYGPINGSRIKGVILSSDTGNLTYQPSLSVPVPNSVEVTKKDGKTVESQTAAVVFPAEDLLLVEEVSVVLENGKVLRAKITPEVVGDLRMQVDSSRFHTDSTSESSVAASGNWSLSEEKNPMNDSKTVVATLPSRPVTGRADKSVDLILRCKDHKIEAYIVWDEYMGSDDVTLKVRIGKTKAGEYLWGISTDHKATFCPGSAVEFVRKLLHADTLAVEATPYDENPITAVFDLKGIEETEAALRNVCPWK